jgi:hypothetical protein
LTRAQQFEGSRDEVNTSLLKVIKPATTTRTPASQAGVFVWSVVAFEFVIHAHLNYQIVVDNLRAIIELGPAIVY